MKNTKFILSSLVFALIGVLFSLALGIAPFFGLVLSLASFLPMPAGIVGINAGNDPELNDNEKKFLEKVQDKISKAVTEFNRGFIDETGLEAKLKPLQESINEIKDSNVSEELKTFKTNFEKSFNDLSATVEKIKEQGTANKKDGFAVAIKSAWDSMKAKFSENDEDKIDVKMTIKALPLTTGTWAGSTNYPFLQDDEESGVTNEPRSPQSFNADVPTGQPIAANSDTWTWIERSTIVDNTGTVAEGGAFGSVEVAYLKNETKVKKIGNYTKITREMLEDWDEFLEAVNDLIATLDNEELNDQLFNGDGTGTNLSGIKINSVEFDANGIEEANANIYDAIKVTITQILVNGLTGWMANKIYMHPIDVTNQEISKDTTGNYVFPPFIMPNGIAVSGIPITQTTDVDQGYFEICDITKARKRFKRELELRIWEQNATDVQNDLLTITGSLRVAFRIKDLEKPAFVYDSFQAAIAILKGSTTSLNMIIAATTGMAQNGIGDASKLTINLLTKAGVTSLTAATLPAYKTGVAAAASIADLTALQVIIDAA